MRKSLFIGLLSTCCIFSSVVCAEVTVKIYTTKDKPPKYLGTITFKDDMQGLMIYPNLKGLSEGMHGFHLHEYPSCAKEGVAAGGHYDPEKTKQHLGPYSHHGDLGDLPALYVNKNGEANKPILAPRLSESYLKNLSVVIHANDDNYSDKPNKVGGSGERIACGVIKD